MKRVGIAGITTMLLLGSIAPASAMMTDTVNGTNGAASQVTDMVNGWNGAASPAMDTAAPQPGGISAEPPVDTKISRERAIELAKQYVTVPDDYVLQGVNYQNMMYGPGGRRGSWSLSYVKQDQKRYYGSINVSIDADSGKLLSYYVNENDPDKKPVFPPKVDLEQAKQIALNYINKMNPDEKDQLQYYNDFEQNYRKPLTGSVQYPLRYVRTVNGVVFPQNFVHVTVDGEGRIREYNKQWDAELSFAKPDNSLSAEQAAEQFKKLAEIRLQYILPNIPKGKIKPILSYQMDPFLLAAQTGKALLPNGAEKDAQSAMTPVSEQPLAEIPKEPLKLTKEQAAERVGKLLPLPADAKLENASYQENHDPRTGNTSTQWDLSWSTASGKDNNNPTIHATVNSSTGAVLRYSKYDYRVMQSGAEADSGSLSYDQLKVKAADYIKKLLPMYAHELYFQPQIGDIPFEKLQHMPNFGFNFRRVINGVYTEYESANVNLDRKTGDIVDFYSSLSTMDYPFERPKTITEEEAKQILLSQYEIELQYMLVMQGNIGMPSYGASMPIEKYNVMVAAGEIKPDAAAANKPETKLVYSLKPKFQFREPIYLDAVTGEWKNRDTNQIVHPLAAAPTDIEGHWAEEALRLMLDYQALDVADGKVQPDGLITRGEMLKMLLAAINGGYFPVSAGMYAERAASFSDVAKDSKYFPYVENAIDRNLIDRSSDVFKPDATLTRSEIADLIVRALGYRKLAQVEGLFTAKATDVQDSAANKGSIAIVSALSIMPLENGKFAPEAQVTRAQAATTFYTFLQVRSVLQDTPGGYPGY